MQNMADITSLKPAVDLPPSIVELIFDYLDNESLARIGKTILSSDANEMTKDIAVNVMNKKVDTIVPHWSTLTPEIQALLPTEYLFDLLVERKNPQHLTKFMRKYYSYSSTRPALTTTQLNNIAYSAFWMLSQLEHPMSPMPYMPVHVLTDDDTASYCRMLATEHLYKLCASFMLVFFTVSNTLLIPADLYELFADTGMTHNTQNWFHAAVVIGLVVFGLVAENTNADIQEKIRWPLHDHVHYISTHSTADTQYKNWLDFFMTNFSTGTSYFIDSHNDELHEKCNKLCEFATQVFMVNIIPISFMLLILFSPVTMPLILLMLFLNNTEDDAHKLRKSGKMLFIAAEYALIFSAVYLNKTLNEGIDEHVNCAEEHVLVCASSLAAGLAGMATLGAINAAPKAVEKSKALLIQGAEQVEQALITARAWCPSWSRAREHELSINEVEMGMVENDQSALLHHSL